MFDARQAVYRRAKLKAFSPDKHDRLGHHAIVLVLSSRRGSMVDDRIGQLRNDWIDEPTLGALYGLSLTDDVWQRELPRWSRLRRPSQPVARGNEVSRFALERFFLDEKLLPMRWAAAKL